MPKVESPFFADHFGPDTPAELLRIARDLNEKGYAVLDFPDAEIAARSARIIDDLSVLVGGGARYGAGASVQDWPQYKTTRVQDAWKSNADVRAIATNQAILDLLSQLYGRQAWPFQTLNFPLGSQQHYHSDSIHFSSMPERFMCGVWVALEDIGPDQGPLEYFPGSHKWPVYTNEHIGRSDVADTQANQQIFEGLWTRLVETTGIKREIFCPKAGQALIWTANLLHGGTPHLDKTKTRWSQVTHYYFEDCAYYTPMSSDPFRGLIRFRNPVNICTGQPVANSFNGRPIDPEFLDWAAQSRTPVTRENFDAAAYLRLNPDVAVAKVDPWHHFTQYGRKEGRAWKAAEAKG